MGYCMGNVVSQLLTLLIDILPLMEEKMSKLAMLVPFGVYARWRSIIHPFI